MSSRNSAPNSPATPRSSRQRRQALEPIVRQDESQDTASTFGDSATPSGLTGAKSLSRSLTSSVQRDSAGARTQGDVFSDLENEQLGEDQNGGQQKRGDGRRAAAASQSSVLSSPLIRRDVPMGTDPPGGAAQSPAPRKRTAADTVGSPLAYPPSSDGPDRRRRQNPLSQVTDGFSRTSFSGSGARALGSTPRNRRGDIAGNRFVDRLLQAQQDGSEGPVGRNLLDAFNGIGMTSEGDVAQSDPAAVTTVIWGTTVNMAQAMNMFRNFILNFCRNDANAGTDDMETDSVPFYPRLLQNLKDSERYNMNLDCSNIRSYRPSLKLYHQLQRYPQEVIPLMDHVLSEIAREMFDDFPEGVQMRVRPFNLERSVNLRQLNPSDIDQLVTVKGILIRSSPLIPDLNLAFFRCHVCDHTVEVETDRGRVDEPTRCPREACKTQNSMRLVHNRCVFADKQICRLQETPDETPDGQTPHTVSMCIYNDLVDVSKAGDRVEITGIFRGVPVRVNPRQRAIKALFKTYVDIVHIKRTDDKRLGVDKSIHAENEYTVDFDEGDSLQEADPVQEQTIIELSQRPDMYDLLSRSIAPSIFGLEDVKKGVLLQLFGGANKFNKEKPGTPRIRGDINILLVGDPGVSKSQLLAYVHKVAPRGVYTSGKGSSAVGLTAYITRDPDSKQLVLESGALVLSDGGICCIDEFDKMSDYTRSVLHEVMEQQTISVAKAGIITTLNARTSILACANPIKSKFDENLSVIENVNLPAPLLSRFDLTYLILDKPNERDDRRLAQHLVGFYVGAEELQRRLVHMDEFVPIETFAKYINYARSKINPVISEDAGEALIDYYVKLRNMGKDGGSNTVTFTTRQLESMIRLAEGHARMRLSLTVDRIDVDEAHRLVHTALQTAAIDPKTGLIDLDLVNTGISSRSRRVHADKRAALRALLQNMDRVSVKWVEAFRMFGDQSDEHIPEYEFNQLLDELSDEGSVHVTGRSNAEKMIRKTGGM